MDEDRYQLGQKGATWSNINSLNIWVPVKEFFIALLCGLCYTTHKAVFLQ